MVPEFVRSDVPALIGDLALLDGIVEVSGEVCTVDGFCGIADPALPEGPTEEREA